MNHYKVLGLKKTASKQEIKAAFKKLAFQCHPDKYYQSPKSVQDNATRRFKQVSEAYEVLMDDRKHAQYNIITGGRQMPVEEVLVVPVKKMPVPAEEVPLVLVLVLGMGGSIIRSMNIMSIKVGLVGLIFGFRDLFFLILDFHCKSIYVFSLSLFR